MAAEALEEIDVSWHGLPAIAAGRSCAPACSQRVPWMTIRERAQMWITGPLRGAGAPDDSPTLVATPGGDVLDVADPALARSSATA